MELHTLLRKSNTIYRVSARENNFTILKFSLVKRPLKWKTYKCINSHEHRINHYYSSRFFFSLSSFYVYLVAYIFPSCSTSVPWGARILYTLKVFQMLTRILLHIYCAMKYQLDIEISLLFLPGFLAFNDSFFAFTIFLCAISFFPRCNSIL